MNAPISNRPEKNKQPWKRYFHASSACLNKMNSCITGTIKLIPNISLQLLVTGIFLLVSSQAEAGTIILKEGTVVLINRVQLASDIPGIIRTVNAKEGSEVGENEIIVQLNDESAQARLKIAEEKANNTIDIEYARIAALVAKNEYDIAVAANKRSQASIGEDVSPPLEVERLKLSYEKSEFQIDKSKVELKIAELTRDEARVDVKNYRILTPFKGVVTDILKRPGEAVRQGEPVLELVNTDIMKVEAEIPHKYVNKVQVGQPVIVQNLKATSSIKDSSIAGDSSEASYFEADIKNDSREIASKKFKGKISFIDYKVNPGRGTVIIWAEVQNQDNILKDGLFADLVINVD